MLPRIAYVTTSDDPDAAVVRAALTKARMEAYVLGWDGAADWSDFDAVVIRSAAFDPDGRQQFLRWARAVEDLTEVANPVRSLARFSDLTYLRDFAQQSIPTSPVVWVEPGDDVVRVAELARRTGWSAFRITGNFGDAALSVDSCHHAAEMAVELSSRGAIVAIEPEPSGLGISVVTIGGRVSHVLAHGGAPMSLPDGAADVVNAVMAAGGPLLFARMELEYVAGTWSLRRFDVLPRELDLDDASANLLAEAVRDVISPRDVLTEA